MGISNVAVKTFDSSGAQSLCRTNEYKGDEEVKSSFISKCQKMYISGSGETVIPGSLRQFPTLNSVDTFYVNSDTDAISDMVFSIEFRFKNPDSSAINTPLFASVSKDIILAIIDRVEIKMGNLTVQTLTADDIYIRNLTELGVPCNFHGPVSGEPHWGVGTGITDARTLELFVAEAKESLPRWENHYSATNYTDDYLIQASCSLPFIGRNKDMSRALLQAGALTNSVTVKVYYNELYKNITEVGGSSIQVISGGRIDGTAFPSGTPDYLDLKYFKSHLKVRTHIMTDTEKKFISKNIIHKVLNTSSNVIKTIPKNLTVQGITSTTTQIEVDLENVSHNVSHLLIAVRLPHVYNRTISCGALGLPMAKYTYRRDARATPFEILNRKTLCSASSGYTGIVGSYGTSQYEVYGYMPCPIESMELVVGSDRTGFIKGSSAQLDTCENFDLKYTPDNKAFYMITLAEKAFDTSGIAFSKTNNKKLIINLNDNIFSQVYEENSLNTADTTYPQDAIITVTACGTKVQSVVGGSMSFL
jgi:hypothetical protein